MVNNVAKFYEVFHFSPSHYRLSHAYSNTESKFSNPAVGQIEKKSDINNGILTHWLFIIDTYLRVADATNTYVKNNLFNKL